MTQIGDSFVRQTGVPLVSLNTICDLTTNQSVVTLKQQPFPNQNAYPGTLWTIPLTLAYGDGLASRTTIAMKNADMQVRLAGCGAVLADPTGQDYYVVNYGDNAWAQLLAQSSALLDPARLTNLKLGTHLLVDNGLAPQSRATAIDSLAASPSVAVRAMRQALMPEQPVERRIPHYQGRLKARPQASGEQQ